MLSVLWNLFAERHYKNTTRLNLRFFNGIYYWLTFVTLIILTFSKDDHIEKEMQSLQNLRQKPMNKKESASII